MAENEGNGNVHNFRRRRKRKRPDNKLTLHESHQIASLIERGDNERRKQAIALRLQGDSYREIAEKMGLKYEHVVKLVTGVLRESFQADDGKLDELRQLELERLDALWSRFFPLATAEEKPSLAAASFLLRVAKRRAELIGLDKEQKITVDARQVHITTDQLSAVREMARDPGTAATLERLAAIYAHGDDVVEAEWADLDSGTDDGQEETEDEGDPEDHPDHHITE